ncbi:cAMP-binding domain of CRP or a regulatory subunit of cAMP-dependent protein kinases [Loktanella atrilutea]|uniref:cAMP-binding domain of CRP or a regulatory subunit of cAMP-dependent protein kinases n=1 Tax=Loktanella atrilutea TaxID=366533 RepID=A0A1M5G575_LOKAT|nr:Crp/Fnr family transcriptional regulator [Loktanella atrilutea]SHF98572.1 cAMP-binding domain of CRP or a regulatory subunit of cAMP-dependent protein kinases [Loktanella atrilutea]
MEQHLQSAFLTRLSRLLDLTGPERDTLEDLERHPEQRRARAPVFDATRPDDRIAILRSGWSAVRVRTGVCKTTIAQIYVAGDVIGFDDLGFGTPPHETTMQTDGSVTLLNRTKFLALASTHPRLFDILVSLASLDTTVLFDRMHTIARLAAEDRLLHFILSLKARIEHGNLQKSDRFPFPFTQQEIGDALGLTDIYVNRLLRRLTDSGELERSRSYIRLRNQKAWEERLGFRDRYAVFDENLMTPVASARHGR